MCLCVCSYATHEMFTNTKMTRKQTKPNLKFSFDGSFVLEMIIKVVMI